MNKMVDISRYLRMTATPAGAILLHILKSIGMSQIELSKSTGIRPQHINSLIKGGRRFSPVSSLNIEKAIGIDYDGFFYMCQCNFDIGQYKKTMQNKPNISNLRKSTFWDVNLEEVDWKKGRRWAILRVLEYGTKEDIDELVNFYGVESFRNEIRQGSSLSSIHIQEKAVKFGLL